MEKISFKEWVELSADLNRRDEFLKYCTVIKGRGGFDFRVVPNRDLVEMTGEEAELENAMAIGNNAERASRRLGFIKDRTFFPNRPVIVSEGDSWFQFPILINEVVDHLNPDHAILSLGAAGDTAANMVHGDLTAKETEYMANLRAQKKHVKAFLFSAAGNDIIGEDPVTKKSALFDIIRNFNGDTDDVLGHINEDVLNDRLAALRAAYTKVVSDVRAEPGLEELPILIHGYDYPFPYPWGAEENRSPIYAKNNEWLGEPLDSRGFPHASASQLALRRNILINLIDRLYDMLNDVAGNAQVSNVWVVDCRNVLTTVRHWNDEIHGTSAGFREIAKLFRQTLNSALKLS
ncbi:hypothetical protein [uncultured Roseovarius sp.]|uniref:hypothetical protein n=1 Tax=uncultured Roseovarius sp. TaxID=293344 RepID=UPI0026069682|nr:hypothetical protein [uncultured Roseovarius sp.]